MQVCEALIIGGAAVPENNQLRRAAQMYVNVLVGGRDCSICWRDRARQAQAIQRG